MPKTATPEVETTSDTVETVVVNTPLDGIPSAPGLAKFKDRLDIEEPPADTTDGEEAVEEEDAPADEEADETPAPETKPAKYSVDEALLNQALELGMSEADARSFGDDAKLERTVGMLMRVRGSGPREPARPEPQREAAPEPTIDDDFKIELGEDIDPAITKSVKGIHDHYKAKTTRLEKTVRALINHINESAKADDERWFESRFGAVEDQYHGEVGKGRSSKVTAAEKAKRDEVKQYVYDLANARRSRASKFDRDDLFDLALKAIAGDKTAEIVREKVTRDISKQRSQALARPTHSNGRPLTADEKLDKGISAWQRKNRSKIG